MKPPGAALDINTQVTDKSFLGQQAGEGISQLQYFQAQIIPVFNVEVADA